MEIRRNGKYLKINGKRAFELREHEDDIVILNGFQIKDDHELQDGDIINIISRGAMPPEDEMESMMAARHTPHVHECVKSARVAIAGLGGLGSNIALMLARTGVGHLLLVDYDVVEPSNLNRQCYDIRHLGIDKTTALQSRIREVNPYIKTEIINRRVNEENACEIFKGYSIICEAFDDPEAKSMIIGSVKSKYPEVFIVGASGMAGYQSANVIRTERSMRGVYICGDFKTEARPGEGLMAPRVSICAGHQANMVLRLILGIEEV